MAALLTEAAPAVLDPKRGRYPPGWFTQTIRDRNWPPDWTPIDWSDQKKWRHLSSASAKAREVCTANGSGWGNGTIPK